MESSDLAQDQLRVVRSHFSGIVERDTELVAARNGIADFLLEQIGDLFIQHLRCRRISHVVALRMVLRRIYVCCGQAFLLNPETVNVVLEAQASRKEWREPKGIVVAGDPAIHPPVGGCNGGAAVDPDINVISGFRAGLILIVQEHLNEVDSVNIICSGSKCLPNLDDCVLLDCTWLQKYCKWGSCLSTDRKSTR